MRIRTIGKVFVLAVSGIAALSMAQTAQKLAFEVASIKAAAPLPVLMAQIQSGTVRPGMSVSGNRFDCEMSLYALITTAYRIKDYQLVGPDWLRSQRFEIHATIPEGTPSDQAAEMLQTLLEERFKLKAHLENKQDVVYALVVSQGGPRLMNADDVSAFFDRAHPTTPNSPILVKQEGNSTVLIDQRTGMVSRGKYVEGVMRLEILRASASALAEYLTPLVDRPIVDATNLKGSYKMTMDLPMEVYLKSIINRPALSDLASLPGSTPFNRGVTPVPPTDGPVGTASDPSGKSVFNAVEKLGLKLDPRKAPIETLIIEQVEKNPTEN